MLIKSLKYFLATIIILLSTVLALSNDNILPKKKPNLIEENKLKKITSNFIFPKEKPGSKKKIIVKKQENKNNKNKWCHYSKEQTINCKKRKIEESKKI